MNYRSTIFALICALAASCAARAAVTDIKAVQVDNSSGGAALDNFRTNDVLIDFTGIARGQQLLLTLTQGSIYQAAPEIGGQDTPPNPFFIAQHPELAFDTFITYGGAGTNTAQGLPFGIPGKAINIHDPPNGNEEVFNTQMLDIAWHHQPGVDILEGTDFLVARISLSKDAMGSFIYFGSTSLLFPNADPLIEEFDIHSGVICQCESPLIPVDGVVGDRAPGDVIEHMFTVSSSAGDVTWSNLVVDGPGMPAIAPVLSADGRFTWDTTNSRIGLYTFSATVSDQFGDAIGELTVTLVPEPAGIALVGLAFFCLAGVAGRQC